VEALIRGNMSQGGSIHFKNRARIISKTGPMLENVANWKKSQMPVLRVCYMKWVLCRREFVACW